MIKYILFITNLIFAFTSVNATIPDVCIEHSDTIYSKCMKRIRNSDMCNVYGNNMKNSCIDCYNKNSDNIDKCIDDKPRETCNTMSIRVYKECIAIGKSQRKCKDLSGRIFFDCYQ